MHHLEEGMGLEPDRVKDVVNDNDNDNDTLRKVQHLSMKAWPHWQECRGHDPAKKKRISCADEACSIGKVCRKPLLGQCAVHRILI